MLKKVLSVVLAAVLTVGIVAVLLAEPTKAEEAAPMTSSEKMIKIVEEMEGFIAVPYWDYGQWTVGFGTRCPDEDLERYQKEGIPYEEAHQLMREHMAIFEGYVNSFMARHELQLEQHQFDALVSFVYNLGPSVLYDTEDAVIRAVLDGADGNEFMFAIGQWCVAGGDYLYGLLRRRMIEAHMYLYGTYSTTLPSSFCYVKYDPNGGSYDGRVQAYDTNMAAVPLSVPAREGYIFTGWYTEATGGRKVTSLDDTTNGITLYAHWEEGVSATDTAVDPITVTVTSKYLSLRQAPGSAAGVTSYLYRGEKITILGVTEKNNTLWGYCNRGWICLEYTDYYELTETVRPGTQESGEMVRVPILATVISASGIDVYGGPHSSYPKVGTLKEGDTVLIVEAVNFCNLLWGRYEGGWVRLNQRLLLHDDQMLAHSFVANIKESYLNVRSGPGTEYSSVGQLNAGDQIEVVAIVMVDGYPWGRFDAGWVYLDTYTDFDSSKMDYYTNHTYGDWYVAAVTNCDQPGQLRRDCIHCDHYELQTTEPKEHIMGQWFVFRESSCAQAGEERRTCTVCTHYESRPIAQLEHTLGQWFVFKESTCTQIGEERRECGDCVYYETRATAQLGHTLGQWYVYRESTCAQAGEERRDCASCSHYESKEIAAIQHEMGAWTQTMAPGCESAGKEESKCAHCNHVQTREIPATGHSMGEWYETTAPTQETDGQARRDCTKCKYTETKVVPAIKHEFGEWYVHLEATCTADGEERRNCTHCEAYESRPIAMKEHSFGQWTTSVAATCVSVGQERRDCTGCDHFETRETAITDHTFGEWFVSVEATCVSLGQERRNCTGCKHYETRTLSLGEHSFGEWYVHRKATCIAAGEERRVCTHCNHYESKELAILDHNFGQWYVSQFASCAAEGQQRRNCADCDHHETAVLPKLEHRYGNWQIVTAPTIDTEGQRERQCADCGDKQTEILPVLETVDRVYATITSGKVDVLADANTGAAQTGELYTGVVAEVLEQKTVGQQVWGRIEFGWICLTGNTTLETVREAVTGDHEDKIYVYLENSGLSVRPEPEEYYIRLGILRQGTRVRVYEVLVLSGNTWARTAYGWVWVTANVKLETQPGQHTEHTYGQWYTVQAGTCLTEALERRDCTECDHYETREDKLGNHSFDEWIVSRDATCVTPGERRRDCQLCDHFEVEAFDSADGHSFGQWQQTVAPDCLNPGQEQRECASCGHVETREIAALDHTFGKWQQIVAPDCLNPGQEQSKCTRCEHTQTREVEALGHSLGQWQQTVAPDCENPGQEQSKCANCDHIETREIAALGHSFSQWQQTAAPDCENAGQEQRECANCGRVETREIQALGHSYGEWKTVTEPTVSTEGLRERQCSVCGSKQTEAIPVLDTIERVYATITSSMVDVLADAHTGSAQTGELYTGVVVEILEQKTVGQQVWGRIEFGWICLTGNTTLETVEEEPGEDTGDKTYIYLENSGLSIRPAPQTYYTRVGILRQGVRVRVYEISVLGGETWARTAYGWVWVTVNIKLETQPGQHTEHTYGQWYTVQAGTCMAAAQERRDCTVCDHYETREGQLGDHSFGQWVVTKEATTAQAGLERRDCDLCDHYEEREIEKLPERIQKVYGWYIDTDYLSIRQGPGTSYERVGWLAPHVQVDILEQTDVNGVVWGRIEQGWVCVTGYIKVVCADIPASSLYATITATQVSIYKGVGTTFETVGTLQKGKSVEVLATVTENGQQWGYTASGWICLTGNATLSDKPASDTADTPNLNFSTGVEDSWFDDALFIGDSRFCGLQAFARSGNATYFCDVGMTVFDYSGKVLSDNSYTNLSLEQLLSSRKFGKIIFNFGLNEAGYVSWYFISKYQELVDMVRSLQPDAILILNGIMSVTESKAAQGDYFSPSHLAELSEKIEAMCDGKTIFYIDCNPYFADANGYLYTELASDGYHPTVYAYRKWRDWIAFAVKQLGL